MSIANAPADAEDADGPPEEGAPTAPLVGTIRYHHDFASDHLGNRRTLVVYLPPGYRGARLRYPVLYLHDGQNVFDPATAATGVAWQANDTAEELIRAGRL